MSSTSDPARRRVLLRADAGSSIGFGHFVRTAALAGYLADSFDCVIASRNPDRGCFDDFRGHVAAGVGASPLEIEEKGREEYDQAFLDRILPDDIVVLDNYFFETEYQEEVRSRCHALVCIDDMHDRHFIADLVMTFSPLSREDFSLEPYTRFVGGVEWAFLRPEFLTPIPERRREDNAERWGDSSGEGCADKPRHLVLAMGGSDPLGLAKRLLEMLLGIDPTLRIDLLAGAAAPECEALPGVTVWRGVDAAKIVELFDSADLGIFPASTMCVEAFSRRLPVAAGHFVDNQWDFYSKGAAEGWFYPLGDLRDPDALLKPRLRALLDNTPPAAPGFDFRATRRRVVDLFKNL